jgi:hypothetical protein
MNQGHSPCRLAADEEWLLLAFNSLLGCRLVSGRHQALLGAGLCNLQLDCRNR